MTYVSPLIIYLFLFIYFYNIDFTEEDCGTVETFVYLSVFIHL